MTIFWRINKHSNRIIDMNTKIDPLSMIDLTEYPQKNSVTKACEEKLSELFKKKIDQFKYKYTEEWEEYKNKFGIKVSSSVRFNIDGPWENDFVHIKVYWDESLFAGREGKPSYYAIPKQFAETALVLGYLP